MPLSRVPIRGPSEESRVLTSQVFLWPEEKEPVCLVLRFKRIKPLKTEPKVKAGTENVIFKHAHARPRCVYCPECAQLCCIAFSCLGEA